MTTQILLVLGLALVHLYAWRLLEIESRVKTHFLSFAGGTAIAYVFLHLIPELAEFHEVLEERWEHFGLGEIAAYMGAVLGLVVFYGLEKLVSDSKRKSTEGEHSKGVFWLHIGSFALYNFVIGHILAEHNIESGLVAWVFFIAMAFHFFTTDLDLYEEHGREYSKVGRWIVIAALVGGWAQGHFTEMSEATFASLFAFVAGGMIMNVMKEELPEAKESKFFTFLIGVVIYGLLLHFAA
jgi:zinc transporter ZupT